LATGAQIDNLPHGQQGHNGIADDQDRQRHKFRKEYRAAEQQIRDRRRDRRCYKSGATAELFAFIFV
jgi:hypothetical protein